MKQLFFGILLLISSFATAQELDNSLVWRVSGNELQGKSYIVATVPLQDSTFFNYPSQAFSYLQKTDVFISLNTNMVAMRSVFKDFRKDYAILPNSYLKQQASDALKPVVPLNKEYVFKEIENTPSKAAKWQLKTAFLSGDLNEISEARFQYDLSKAEYEKIQERTNYSIVNDLITQMRLQPVYFPVDAVYLSGQTGILNLLKARGYQVVPMQRKFYKKKAESIKAQQVIQQQAPLNNPTTTPQQQNSTPIVIEGLQPTKQVKLDMPIGILNMKQWSSYVIEDSLIVYEAPNRLKSGELGVFSTATKALEYEIAFTERKDLNLAIQQLIIDNGGQVTYTQQLDKYGFPALMVEMIYTENTLSKHLLIELPNRRVIVTVKGTAPEIFSVEASRFLNSIQIQGVSNFTADTPNASVIEDPVENSAPQWQFYAFKEMSISLPVEPEKEITELKDGSTLEQYYIPRGKVDNNVYYLGVSNETTFDNFKLFNNAINTAANTVRGVIEERNVMPAGQPNFAGYLVKDAIGNYYKINYWYYNSTLYQFIVKGDKKTINSSMSKQIEQSISMSFNESFEWQQ